MANLEKWLSEVEAEYGPLWWVVIPEGQALHIATRILTSNEYFPDLAVGSAVLPVFTKRESAQEFAQALMRPEVFMRFLEEDGADISRVLVEDEWRPREAEWDRVAFNARRMGVEQVALNLFCTAGDHDPIAMVPVADEAWED